MAPSKPLLPTDANTRPTSYQQKVEPGMLRMSVSKKLRHLLVSWVLSALLSTYHMVVPKEALPLTPKTTPPKNSKESPDNTPSDLPRRTHWELLLTSRVQILELERRRCPGWNPLIKLTTVTKTLMLTQLQLANGKDKEVWVEEENPQV